MHELTIAMEIMRVVRESVSQEQLKRIKIINLIIGRATAVQDECLRFSLDAVAKQNSIEGLECTIEYIEPLFKCRSCDEEFESGAIFGSPCPQCGKYDVELIKGDELSVASVDLE